jgi:hypothetical protein
VILFFLRTDGDLVPGTVRGLWGRACFGAEDDSSPRKRKISGGGMGVDDELRSDRRGVDFQESEEDFLSQSRQVMIVFL